MAASVRAFVMLVSASCVLTAGVAGAAEHAECAALRAGLDRPLAARRIEVARGCARVGDYEGAREELRLALEQSQEAAPEARRALAEVERLEAAAALRELRAEMAAAPDRKAEREGLARIVARFPGTPAADEARASLAAMGRGPDGETQGRWVTVPGPSYARSIWVANGVSLITMPLLVGIPGYVVAAPVIHAVEGEPANAVGSLVMRIGFPLVLGALAAEANDRRDLEYGLFGALGGALLAMTLDAAVLARSDDQRMFVADGEDVPASEHVGPKGERPRLSTDAFGRMGSGQDAFGARVGWAFLPEVAVQGHLLVPIRSAGPRPDLPGGGLDLQLRPAAGSSRFTPVGSIGFEVHPLFGAMLAVAFGFEWQGYDHWRFGLEVGGDDVDPWFGAHFGRAF